MKDARRGGRASSGLRPIDPDLTRAARSSIGAIGQFHRGVLAREHGLLRDHAPGNRFAGGEPLTTAMSCGPSSGLHSTVTLSLPATMASSALRLPSIEITRMSLPGLNPAPSMASMAPSAMVSLCANTTRMRRPSACRNPVMTSRARARSKSALCERMMR